MKGLNWFDKFLYFFNCLLAAILLFAYLLPFIPPKSFALLSVLTLGVPFLIIANLLFLLYWLLRLKKQVLLSLIVLLIGFNHLTSVYEFSAEDEVAPNVNNLSFITYNVRQFNQYEWSERIDIPQKISEFIIEEDPDFIAMQEYYKGELTIAESFPHKFIYIQEENAEFGLAILSKYPIIKSGSLDFPTPGNNNAIFADVVVAKDTLRIINVHLQSFGVKPELDELEQNKKRVFMGMGRTFAMQQEQMELVIEMVKKTPHPVVLMGDFNNTAYSYIYREILSLGFNDAYKTEGNGFGRTFDFDYFPLRIDYIMAQEAYFDIIQFETFEVPYSDHFPIKAIIKFNSNGLSEKEG
ncbi:MAG TPA: endonuclease/exonuclease/phosphatase family protein [Salinimicrobium sp.]|nr:endonuclease/exonuclease/phosphatase family protein [Salinimicrobium sp.]